jgi:hypothetical protein
VAADCNDGLVKERHPESNLFKSTFLPNQRINLTDFPLRSILAAYPNVIQILENEQHPKVTNVLSIRFSDVS